MSRLAHTRFPHFQLPTDVTDALQKFRFSRDDWAHHCGGSPQGTFPTVGEMKDEHGHDRFMFQDKTHNPYAPNKPGSHGSHFACRDIKQWPRTDGTLECLVVKEDTNKWGAFGLYKCERAAPLTKEEFSLLPKKVSFFFQVLLGRMSNNDQLI